MKRVHILITILLLAASIIFAEGTKYGEEITLKEKTDINTILSSPDKYEGEKVLVEGEIVEVCSSSGCWIKISDEKTSRIITVKVEDGVIVFPESVKGKKALVEGIVYAKETTPSSGGDCGSKISCGGCGGSKSKMTKVYQIKGLGAVIS